MGVLLQFNDNTAESLSTEDIHVGTQLNEAMLRTTLLSLVKTKVLLINSEDENITKASKFSLNKGFRSKRARVLINVPIREAQQKETGDVHKSVEEDRKLQIQVCFIGPCSAYNRALLNLWIGCYCPYYEDEKDTQPHNFDDWGYLSTPKPI